MRWLPAISSRAPGELRAGIALFFAIAVISFIGPLLAADPTAITDPGATSLLPPGTVRTQADLRDGTTLIVERATIVAGGWRFTRLGQDLLIDASRVAAVHRRIYLFGSDSVGRDVLARTLAGGRNSLAVGLSALALTLIIGLGVGALAGWAGGVIDAVLMRVVDAVLAIPLIFLMLLVATLMRPSPLTLVLILGASTWMGVARLVRAQVLSLKSRPFVLAARVAGASMPRILLRHVFPNALTPITQDAALRLGDLILIEASLSYLGFGVRPPTPSWGGMVADAQAVLGEAWWPAALPVVLIALTVIAAALVADGLQHAQRRQSTLE